MKHYSNLSSEHMENKSSAELFHGFQTIRAVERDRIVTGLSTPEFATYVENLMKNEARTEYVLKLANNKLERALSSDHNARMLQETTKAKHNRTTLSELFQKTEMVEEKTEIKSNIGKHNSHLMTRKLKRSTPASARANDFASADEKLHKILQMVHLKALTNSQNMWKYVKKSNLTNDDDERCRNRPEDIMIFPYRAVSVNQTKSKVSHPTYPRRERWIKSDAEYLILEL
ncbi:hypothetical protein L1987_62595 [Smallanthus sonchifolius]|uniref:Uncharacterized protein n=1 Tax=Smallanthus sonchifolius TaxID=185202 RepID=A0ACB9CAW0_9ASTR|nr:hypothetical protein L1987_62595 [Smallanthus sonchifolius]